MQKNTKATLRFKCCVSREARGWSSCLLYLDGDLFHSPRTRQAWAVQSAVRSCSHRREEALCEQYHGTSNKTRGEVADWQFWVREFLSPTSRDKDLAGRESGFVQWEERGMQPVGDDSTHTWVLWIWPGISQGSALKETFGKVLNLKRNSCFTVERVCPESWLDPTTGVLLECCCCSEEQQGCLRRRELKKDAGGVGLFTLKQFKTLLSWYDFCSVFFHCF